MKVTKQQRHVHAQCESMLGSDPMNGYQRQFVLEHWNPWVGCDITGQDIYFTPMELALHLAAITGPEGRVLDLCAGIGRLAYLVYQHQRGIPGFSIECLELDPVMFEVGSKVLPKATWHLGDMEKALELGPFDYVVCNPPFSRGLDKRAVEIALEIAPAATFILLKPPAGTVGELEEAIDYGAIDADWQGTKVRPKIWHFARGGGVV